jgi:hypothetical protein
MATTPGGDDITPSMEWMRDLSQDDTVAVLCFLDSLLPAAEQKYPYAPPVATERGRQIVAEHIDDPDERLRERNRENAQKSTGPKTDAGKAHSRTNATRHGLTSQAPLITGESEEAWNAFRDELLASLAPVSGLETALATRAAQLLWRMGRIAGAEAKFLDPERSLPDRIRQPGVWGDVQSLMRYESHLNRQLQQTLYELRGWQNLRSIKEARLLAEPKGPDEAEGPL